VITLVKIELEDYNGNTTAILDFKDFDVADCETGEDGDLVIRIQDTIKSR